MNIRVNLSSKEKQDYDCSSGGSHCKESQAMHICSLKVFLARYSQRGLAEFSARTLRIRLLQAGGEKNGIAGIPLSCCICLNGSCTRES